MSKLDPQASFTVALVRVARLYRMGVDEALDSMDLSDALALPVVVLGRKPQGVRQNMLADELGVEGPSLVRLLDRLMQDGLVERHEDPSDRRAKIVRLTARGREHSLRASRKLDSYRATLLEDISPDDIAACQRVLDAIEARLLETRRADAS